MTPREPVEVSMIDLNGIRARCEAATPGPWEWVGNGLDQKSPGYAEIIAHSVECMAYCYGGSVKQEATDADREFIAHARSDIPALLAHVSLQEAEIARLKALVGGSGK